MRQRFADGSARMHRDAVMSTAAAFVLSLVCATLFAISAYFIFTRHELDYLDRPGNHSFSTAALGQSALLEIMRAIGIDIRPYRYNPDVGVFAADGHMMALIEPPNAQYIPAARTQFNKAAVIFVVMPKRVGAARSEDKRLTAVEMLELKSLAAIAESFIPGVELVRPTPQRPWTVNKIGVTPQIADAQLLKSDQLIALVGNEHGVLLGEVKDAKPRTLVLSDPDILANHGIVRGDNALFAAHLLARFAPAGRPILVDETMHGFLKPPFVWSSLFELPWAVLLIAFGALFLTLGLVALGRFGPVLPRPAHLRPGKELLLDNTARLMSMGEGAAASIIQEYFHVLRLDVAERLHAPRTAREGSALTSWLSRGRRADRVTEDFAALARDVEGLGVHCTASAAMAAARRMHRWREEILRDGRSS